MGQKIYFLWEMLYQLPPLFDAFATNAWSAMKRRTETMFTKRICYEEHDNCDHDYENLSDYQKSREGVAAKFFNKLQVKQKKKNQLEIILVGHSMGAIVANKVLTRWPEINFSKIVYLAAASSVEDFKLSVLPYMKVHPETHFYNLTLHPIAENTETYGLGFGQTGSLLTQIDNFYESPTYENKRTLGRWTNVVNNIDYLNDEKENKSNGSLLSRLHFRTLPLGNGYPEKHGDFDEVEFIKNGRFWLGELGEKNHFSDKILSKELVRRMCRTE